MGHPPALHRAHAAGVHTAYQAALRAYRSGVGGMDIVLAALEELERDPTFDAGRGSFLNECGEVELDAGVMEGTHLRAGAVAGIRNFLHPSKIAFDVLSKTHHAFLVGEGAERFAESVVTLDCQPTSWLIRASARCLRVGWLRANPMPRFSLLRR